MQVSSVRDYQFIFFFFQAEDGIRDSSTSRGLGDVYKRQRPTLLGLSSLFLLKFS
ncbi:hypothetical protein MUDAN_IGPPGNFN_03624 [Lactiplantibacillus mudanjiangensis]|nr:hypothetical protein MUDAN_IGPPGNFN_03624 [Lactiplantibacillus mudanjiangensis]